MVAVYELLIEAQLRKQSLLTAHAQSATVWWKIGR